MSHFPLDPFFVEAVTHSATHIAASGGAETELDVIFDNRDQKRNAGESEYIDGGPTALCKSFDIPDVKKGDTLRIHDALIDESGNYLVDEEGNIILASNVAEYVIQQALRDEAGTTELVLSEDA